VKHKTQTKRVLVAVALATIGIIAVVLVQGYTYQEKQRQQLQQTLQEKVELQKVLEKKQMDSQETQKQIEQLKKELQAKKDSQARALAEAQKAPTRPVQARVAVSGTCAEWIAAAGITDVQNAAELIRRESGCNPNAINRSSGACGVAQELPCGKSGCALGDGACQVRWMNGYVLNRYKSWAAAVQFHNRNNWY
jgi:Tfp pilus assembly protein PilV